MKVVKKAPMKLSNYSIRGKYDYKNGINTSIGRMSDIHPIYKEIEIKIDSRKNNSHIWSLFVKNSSAWNSCHLDIKEFAPMISQCGGVSIGNCFLAQEEDPIKGLVFFSIRQVLINNFPSQKLVMASGPEGCYMDMAIKAYNDFADEIGTFNKWEVSKTWYNPNSNNDNNLYTLDLNREKEPLGTISNKTIEFLEQC